MDSNQITAVDSILHLIEDHGLSLVLLLLIIFWLRPKINALWRNQLEEKRKKSSENIENVLAFSLSAKGILREALVEFKSDWAVLWQFHNGVYSVGKNHLPFMFLTMTHEVHNSSVQSMAHNFKSLPLGMIDTRVLTTFIRQQIVVHSYDSTHPVNSGMAGLMNDLNAKRGYSVPIRDEDGQLCAIFSVAFSKDITLDASQMESLQIFARRTAWYMANLGMEPTDLKGNENESNA